MGGNDQTDNIIKYGKAHTGGGGGGQTHNGEGYAGGGGSGIVLIKSSGIGKTYPKSRVFRLRRRISYLRSNRVRVLVSHTSSIL